MLKDCIEEISNLGFSKENVLFDEPMNKHTTFKIGGNADIFIKAKTIEQVEKVLKVSNKYEVPLYIFGNGSNTLVADKGIRGIVLKIEIDTLKIENNIVTVGAGRKLMELVQIFLKNSLSGFEFASGIPGTIGGAIRMNAGAYSSEMKDVVLETTYITREGSIGRYSNQEQEFSYRRSIFCENKYIILETKLKLKHGDKQQIKEKMEEYTLLRKQKQPTEYPSAGSTFKRIENIVTAKLIDECNLKGYTIGGAQISLKHAGFIVNTGDATAKDVINLIDYTKKKVYEKFEIKIKEEIELVGEF